jgi:hypothetical protein
MRAVFPIKCCDEDHQLGLWQEKTIGSIGYTHSRTIKHLGFR